MIQTLSNDTLTLRRAETMNAQPIRKVVSVREVNLIDDSTIEWNGQRLQITETAFKNLIGMIGMNKTFSQKFETLFNSEAKAKFINQMKNAMATQLNQLVMIVSPIQRKVVGFTTKVTDIISNEQFLNLSDGIIDQHGFEVTNWGIGGDGSVTINAMNPKAQFEIAGANEVFSTGITLQNSPNSGIQVMPYVNRLFCTNGLTTSVSREAYQLQDLTPQSMENFFEHMAQLRRNGFVPVDFSNTVKRAIVTPASLWELERAHKAIKPWVGERAENIIPLSQNMDAYKGIGHDPTNLTADQKRRARTNQSIWSLVNGVTWTGRWAPEHLSSDMQDKDSTKLMIQAGEMLGGNWNLANEMPTPFAAKLDPTEQLGALLN
jgi:hypothetical protein